MSDSRARGERIKARRLALGINSMRQFHAASGISREALTAIEGGEGTPASLDRAEAWLDRMEEETGHDEPAEPLRVTLRDVYGVGEIVVEGPVDHPDELVASVARLLDEIRSRG